MISGLTMAWPTKHYLSTDVRQWQWVRLSELCEVLGRIRNSPNFTPDELVINFAHLARPIESPFPYFWYAREILSDSKGIEVPQSKSPEDAIQFAIRYNPYYKKALVPDGWAQDVAKAIRKGATEVVTHDSMLYMKTIFGKLQLLT